MEIGQNCSESTLYMYQFGQSVKGSEKPYQVLAEGINVSTLSNNTTF